MAKARAGFRGPYGLGINQIVKGMGGAEYIASLLIGYTGKEKEEAGAILNAQNLRLKRLLAKGLSLGDGCFWEL